MNTRPELPEAILDGMSDRQLRSTVSRYLQGGLSAEMALMYALHDTRNFETLQAALAAAIRAGVDKGLVQHTGALNALSALATENRPGCERIVDMLRSGVDTDAPAASVDEGIAFCKRLFNWSVGQCMEASVALYSLGNPAILEAATAEVVEVMRQWRLLGRTRSLLEIGCGIGRFQKALAADVQAITGIDVAVDMIRAARRRCEGCSNVSLLECSGRDLAIFAPKSFDLVFAVDSFPYLVQCGMALVEKHFSEVRRVLRPGGDFLILEFSYGRDLEADRRDVERLATGAFEVIVNGEQPFRLWDGSAFRMRALP